MYNDLFFGEKKLLYLFDCIYCITTNCNINEN